MALIEENHLVGEYPAVVLSLNQVQNSFETEIRKRCLVLNTGASLPDHAGVSRTIARQVKPLKAQLGTAFYRPYLLRVCERLQAEGFLRDNLATMVALFREALPPEAAMPAVRRGLPRRPARLAMNYFLPGLWINPIKINQMT